MCKKTALGREFCCRLVERFTSVAERFVGALLDPLQTTKSYMRDYFAVPLSQRRTIQCFNFAELDWLP
jgi:hypothetical protein